MNSTLVKNRLYYANSRGKNGTTDFNCWGATLFVLGMTHRLDWIERYEMEELLDDNAHNIKADERTRGDILALWVDGCLIHTAVYMGRNKFFHKRGMNNSEITKLDGILAIYNEFTGLTYMRLNDM